MSESTYEIMRGEQEMSRKGRMGESQKDSCATPAGKRILEVEHTEEERSWGRSREMKWTKLLFLFFEYLIHVYNVS